MPQKICPNTTKKKKTVSNHIGTLHDHKKRRAVQMANISHIYIEEYTCWQRKFTFKFVYHLFVIHFWLLMQPNVVGIQLAVTANTHRTRAYYIIPFLYASLLLLLGGVMPPLLFILRSFGSFASSISITLHIKSIKRKYCIKIYDDWDTKTRIRIDMYMLR